MNNDQFRRDYAALLRRVGDKAALVVRKTTLELQRSMVLKSPVDTGRFRANWQIGDRSMNVDTSASPDKGGDGAVTRAAAALEKLELGGVIFLTNSMPYARVLEYGQYGKPPGSANGPKTTVGYSRQAPQGMVRLTVTEYGQYLRKVVGESKT